MYIRAYIKLVSKHVMLEKPAIFSIGGFSGKTEDDRDIMFDWAESAASFEINEDGKGVFEVWLKEFDEEFFKGSNESVSIEEVTPAFLAKCKLTEIFYECFINDVDDPLIPLIVEEFALSGSDGNAEFTKEQLQEYDKEYAIWRD
jgi:hypothetical protein